MAMHPAFVASEDGPSVNIASLCQLSLSNTFSLQLVLEAERLHYYMYDQHSIHAAGSHGKAISSKVAIQELSYAPKMTHHELPASEDLLHRLLA